MKKYKVVPAKLTKAEDIMNEMAAKGWEVAFVTYWAALKFDLVITFSKEVKEV